MGEYENKNETQETEKCILCGEDTGVPKTLHIDFRDCYIEGAGQLCISCYKETQE